MEPGGSIMYSHGLSNNPYPEPNQPNCSYETYFIKIHSNIFLPYLPKGLFPVAVPVKIFKALLPSSILAI